MIGILRRKMILHWIKKNPSLKNEFDLGALLYVENKIGKGI